MTISRLIDIFFFNKFFFNKHYMKHLEISTGIYCNLCLIMMSFHSTGKIGEIVIRYSNNVLFYGKVGIPDLLQVSYSFSLFNQ